MVITYTLNLMLIFILINFIEYDNISYIIIKINIFKYDITNFEILFNLNFYNYRVFITKIFKNFYNFF